MRTRPLLDGAAALLVIGVFWAPAIVQAGSAWRSIAGWALALVVAAAMLSRWRTPLAPVAAGGATIMATVLGVCQDPMLGCAWCLYAAAVTHASRARTVVLVFAGVVAGLAAVTGVDGGGAGGVGQRLVIAVAALSVAWLLGSAAGRQAELAREAERARATEHAARVQLEVAREVHDVVGHALGVISAEVAVVRALPDTNEKELRDTLAGVEDHARGALQEMQSLVRSLRGGPESVTPGIAQVPSLIAATRSAGVLVEARLEAVDGVDDTVGAAVYRIVQEALSNVVRHAPGAACAVHLDIEDDVIVIRVRDEGPGMEEGDVPGFGLRGMSERAGRAGGTVVWRNRPERGFEVEARFPT